MAWFSQLDDGTVRPVAPAQPTRHLAAGETATPDALAVAVLAGELPRSAEEAVCLSVDGADPAPSLLAARFAWMDDNRDGFLGRNELQPQRRR
jgi:hypothetical protein